MVSPKELKRRFENIPVRLAVCARETGSAETVLVMFGHNRANSQIVGAMVFEWNQAHDLEKELRRLRVYHTGKRRK